MELSEKELIQAAMAQIEDYVVKKSDKLMEKVFKYLEGLKKDREFLSALPSILLVTMKYMNDILISTIEKNMHRYRMAKQFEKDGLAIYESMKKSFRKACRKIKRRDVL